MELLPPFDEAMFRESNVLTPWRVDMLRSVFPPMYAISEGWTKRYDLLEHGASLETMYQRCGEGGGGFGGGEAAVLLCMDSWSYVFGAFVVGGLRESGGQPYSNGESFVFTFKPSPTGGGFIKSGGGKGGGTADFAVFGATPGGGTGGVATGFHDGFALGTGGDGFALYLDETLDHGESEASTTFGNTCLASTAQFRCINVEVWYLDA